MKNSTFSRVSTMEDYSVKNSNCLDQQLKCKRSTTDIASLVIYSIFFVAWIGIAIYACTSYSIFSPIGSLRGVIEIVGYLFYRIDLFFFCCFCYTALIVFYFILLRWCTKFTVYLTVFLKFLVMSLPMVALFFKVNPLIAIIALCFSYAIFWIEIQILRKVEIDTVCRIIVDACRVTIAFPSSLLIALLLFCITTSLITFMGSIINTVMHSSMNVNNIGLAVIFSICSLWILLTNYLCMQSALYGMFTNWCRMENRSTISNFSITLQYLFWAYRYHMGTFACMSVPITPIVHIIQIIRANVQEWQKKFKESRYNIYCFIVIIIGSINNASITCASYGKCFNLSMKNAFPEIIRNSMKFTAIRLITIWMILFGLTLIPSIMIGLALLYADIVNTDRYATYLAVSGTFSTVLTSGVLFVFNAAVDSVLFCHLEKLSGKSKFTDGSSKEDRF